MASWRGSEAIEQTFPAEGDYAPRRAVESDWKPQKRIRATKTEWQVLREAFADVPCVHCGLPNVEALHHIVFRSEGGSDIIENLAPLCRADHDAFHARSTGWERVAASIRQYVVVDNHRRHYVENMLGDRFNRRYPPLPNTDPQFISDFRRIYHLDGEETI